MKEKTLSRALQLLFVGCAHSLSGDTAAQAACVAELNTLLHVLTQEELAKVNRVIDVLEGIT